MMKKDAAGLPYIDLLDVINHVDGLVLKAVGISPVLLAIICLVSQGCNLFRKTV